MAIWGHQFGYHFKKIVNLVILQYYESVLLNKKNIINNSSIN